MDARSPALDSATAGCVMDEDTEQAAWAQYESEAQQQLETVMQYDQIAPALAKAQAEFAEIKRDKTVSVQTRTGGKYTFSYAPLETILHAVMPALNKNGLFLTQAVERSGDAEYVRTTLIHTSGQTLFNVTRIMSKDDGPQAYGSAITYGRRYGISTLLCIAADDDDDANAAEGNATETKRTRSPLRPPSPVDRFREALEDGTDLAIYAVHNELNADQTAYKAAWSQLNPSEKRDIKDAIERMKEGAPAMLANGRAA